MNETLINLFRSLVFVFLMGLIICSCQHGTSGNTDWQKYKLNGKVKEVREVTYKAVVSNSKIKKGAQDPDVFSKQLLFNRHGLLEEQSSITQTGKVFVRTQYNYQNGRPTGIHFWGPDQKVQGFDTLFYSSNGKVIERKSYSREATLNSTQKYTYDSTGKVLEFRLYSAEDDLLARMTYQYDANGHPQNVIEYNPDGTVNRERLQKFDTVGNETELNWFNPDKTLSARWTFQYDEKGNQTQKDSYNSGGKLYVRRTFQYAFDSKGNWIKQIKYVDGRPSRITEREIIYY